MASGISTLSLDVLLSQLDQAVAWLRSKGDCPTLNSSRVGRWQKELAQFRDCVARGDLTSYDEPGGLAALATSLNESSGLYEIYLGLSGYDAPEVDARIRKLIKGPFFPEDEIPGSGSHVGRDTAFELRLMSRFRRAGYSLKTQGLADVCAVTPAGCRVFVECKRPQSAKGVSRCFRDARDQLRSRLVVLKPRGSVKERGLIALDISSAFAPFPALLIAEDERALQSELADAVKGFAREHARVWEKASGRAYKKIVGTLVFLGVPALLRDPNTPMACRQFLLIPGSKRQGDRRAAEEILEDLAAG